MRWGVSRLGIRIFGDLREAGGRVEWYQPLRLSTFKRWNNRTHRKLLIVDGRVAFCGGADIADEWLYGAGREPSWRDTVFCFRGDLVNGLQSTFAENWLEASGEILADGDYFPLTREAQGLRGRESGGDCGEQHSVGGAGGQELHILYQTLLAYAGKTVWITTPYFLPDESTLAEITKAVKERGVKVVVLTAGKHADHLFTRVRRGEGMANC